MKKKKKTTKSKKPKKQPNTEITDVIQPESNFFDIVETHMATANVEMIDAILTYCQKRGIEVEQVIPLIKSNSKFKKRLTEEAIALHFIKERK